MMVNICLKQTSFAIAIALCSTAHLPLRSQTAPPQIPTATTEGSAAISGRTIPLWPNGAPGALGTLPVDIPTITIYLPANNPTHTGVIVCPGGGYEMLATDKEGTKVAEWLNARGVAAFVLAYRLGPRYHYPVELRDAQRAIQFVRSHAVEYDLDPTHIGIFGSSAGGHLASTAGTHFAYSNTEAADPIGRVNSRPDFLVLLYPVISMYPGTTHLGSLHNLLGEEPDPALERELSNETQITPLTPPTFLFSTTNDQTVPVMNSVLFYEALLRAGVPAEMHLFEQGHHGSGLAQGNVQLQMWPVLLQNWLNLHGWMAENAK